jgi:type 1 fimbria pilin
MSPFKKGIVIIILLLIVATVYLLLNSQSKDINVDIRGKITKISNSIDTDAKFILVEGELEIDTAFDKAHIRVVPKDTQISIIKDNKRIKGKISDLKEHSLVEVDFGNNPVAESYPVQTKAKRILIINN